MNFAIVCTQRTGSTLLTQLLDQQEDVLCNGAVFDAHPGRMPVRWAKDLVLIRELERLRDSAPEDFLSRVFAETLGCRAVGFKICPGHNDAMLDKLLVDSAIAKIVLFRRNVLAVYSSAMIARRSGERRSTAPDTVPESRPLVEFDQKKFMRFWERYIAYYRSVFERLNTLGQVFHLVDYTELNDPRHFSRIINFVGSASTKSVRDTKNRKQNSSDIISRFSNSEVAAAFLKQYRLTGWGYETEAFLDPGLFG